MSGRAKQFKAISCECDKTTTFDPRNIVDVLLRDGVLIQNEVDLILDRTMRTGRIMGLFDILSLKAKKTIENVIEVVDDVIAEIMKRHLSELEEFQEYQKTSSSAVSASTHTKAWEKVLKDSEARTLLLDKVSVSSIQQHLWAMNILSNQDWDILNNTKVANDKMVQLLQILVGKEAWWDPFCEALEKNTQGHIAAALRDIREKYHE